MNHRPIDAVFNRSRPLDSSVFLSLGLMLFRLRLAYVFEPSAGSSVPDLERVLAARKVQL
jgi:hypothetical protein